MLHSTFVGGTVVVTFPFICFSGYSQEQYDRYVLSQDRSVVNKFQQKYWKTKQTLIKVTGKKEDEYVVASDADLDAKLEVQSQVRHSKTSFDKLKNDVCQKVDLLGASRCNLLSHVLTTYQTTLLHFWEKTSHTMAAIHESFKGYQPYEFTMIKSLQDPMNKLLDQGEKKKGKKKIKENTSKKTPDMDNQSGRRDIAICHFISAPQDLLIDSSSQEHDGGDKDEMAFMNEILNTSSLEDEDFSKHWQAVFGEDISLSSANTSAAGETLQDDPSSSGFLPSQLLDQNMNNFQSSFAETPKPAKDLSAWFSLFADLDPLSNPDAVGKTDKEHELLNA
ncbi:UNVERIFIED_CONTAM: hypothetical protein FKN15_067997 [Acipenser sinensis]